MNIFVVRPLALAYGLLAPYRSPWSKSNILKFGLKYRSNELLLIQSACIEKDVSTNVYFTKNVAYT